MKTNVLILMLLGSTLAISGCTKSTPRVVQVENPKAEAGEEKKPEINTTVTTIGDGQAAVSLDEQQLKSVYAIDTGNMTYKFEYLGKSQQDTISFVNNKATLTFKNLPAEQSGTVKLELFEAGVLKLSATQENVVLKKGVASQISLKLVAVTNPIKNPATTDLSIDVTLEEKTPDTSIIKPADSLDPIASWNGKEHKGNTRWSIISVD